MLSYPNEQLFLTGEGVTIKTYRNSSVSQPENILHIISLRFNVFKYRPISLIRRPDAASELGDICTKFPKKAAILHRATVQKDGTIRRTRQSQYMDETIRRHIRL